MKRPHFPYFRAFYTVVSLREISPEIALIVDTPFVETLLVLPEYWRFSCDGRIVYRKRGRPL